MVEATRMSDGLLLVSRRKVPGGYVDGMTLSEIEARELVEAVAKALDLDVVPKPARQP
jgi:hypothetical protein